MSFTSTASRSTSSRLARAAFAAGAFAAASLFGGCAYDPENVSFDYIKGHVSPELDGLTERPVDIQRNLAVNEDQTLRMFWADLGRTWLMDQPSMLSPYYIISTNGQPR